MHEDSLAFLRFCLWIFFAWIGIYVIQTLNLNRKLRDFFDAAMPNLQMNRCYFRRGTLALLLMTAVARERLRSMQTIYAHFAPHRRFLCCFMQFSTLQLGKNDETAKNNARRCVMQFAEHPDYDASKSQLASASFSIFSSDRMRINKLLNKMCAQKIAHASTWEIKQSKAHGWTNLSIIVCMQGGLGEERTRRRREQFTKLHNRDGKNALAAFAIMIFIFVISLIFGPFSQISCEQADCSWSIWMRTAHGKEFTAQWRASFTRSPIISIFSRMSSIAFH